jgi:hypothetical protein
MGTAKLTKAQRDALEAVARNGLNYIRRHTAKALVRRGLLDGSPVYEKGPSGSGVMCWFLTDAGRAALKGGA